MRRRIREKLPALGLGAGYGLTETNGLVCAVGNVELDTRPHTSGPPLPTVMCRILGKDGSVCAAGKSGEIQLSGAMMMRGYCGAEDAMGGWFATGDIGYLSDDGYLHVIDKEDRFLRDGDDYISCREIEDATREIAGFLDVAALAVDNGEDGQLVIVTAPGIEDFSGIRASLAQQFPSRIIDRARFVVAEHLPRTASGKIAYGRLLKETA
jgi:acyl-CoA synthetase (AMP-forming)/AMP-acid ligase II